MVLGEIGNFCPIGHENPFLGEGHMLPAALVFAARAVSFACTMSAAAGSGGYSAAHAADLSCGGALCVSVLRTVPSSLGGHSGGHSAILPEFVRGIETGRNRTGAAGMVGGEAVGSEAESVRRNRWHIAAHASQSLASSKEQEVALASSLFSMSEGQASTVHCPHGLSENWQ